HNLGIALNYRDDPRLRDVNVLNPHWVTNGIYKIINSEKIANQDGELFLDDLLNILDQKDYPPEKHNFILELMRKFELSFRFPESEDHYLVTDLLDRQQPAEADDFKPEECLNFQYHYPVIPQGILPRFIVRSHVLSTNRPRWWTGVILEFEGSVALVKADLADKKVYISIKGNVASRRRLLAVIRSDFDNINSNFRFKPDEMVPISDYPTEFVSYEELCVMERNGIETYPKAIGGKAVYMEVKKLLDGVDLERTKGNIGIIGSTRKALRLFYSYSHKDEEFRDELETHLKLMQRQGLIESWHDRKITAGDEWKDQIDDNLERADIILLLVSADFIASDYCYDIEMRRALERHDAGEAVVIPVIIRDVNWKRAPFSRLGALPRDGKAVATWGPDKNARDTAWRNVSEGIEKVIEQLTKRI
ncbi:MAG: COR domain-containing protein, partial [Candidatus Poribacteria bacterium]